jgi:hypothetical protein
MWWLSRIPLGACFVVGLLVCFCKRLEGGNPSDVDGGDGEEDGGNPGILKLTTAWGHSKQSRSMLRGSRSHRAVLTDDWEGSSVRWLPA